MLDVMFVSYRWVRHGPSAVHTARATITSPTPSEVELTRARIGRCPPSPAISRAPHPVLCPLARSLAVDTRVPTARGRVPTVRRGPARGRRRGVRGDHR
jgi:hypothetical protein